MKESRMVEIGIVGAKNSGKTTLIETLIRLLSERGHRVATIKHTGHDHAFDTEGKDSQRHRAAGAIMTMAVSRSEIALFGTANNSNQAAATQLLARDCDLCLVEGDKSSARPKVLLTRNIDDLNKTPAGEIIASYGPTDLGNGTMNFALEQTADLARFLEQTIRAREEQTHG